MWTRFSESPVLLSFLMILLGLVLILWPNPVLSLIITVLGIGLLAGGAIAVIGWFRHREEGFRLSGLLGGGIAALILGALAVSRPTGVASLFPVLMGVAIVVNGVINGARALELKSLGYGRWPVLLLMAVITIIAGTVFILQPEAVLASQIVLAGFVLVYNGLTSLWIMTRAV